MTQAKFRKDVHEIVEVIQTIDNQFLHDPITLDTKVVVNHTPGQTHRTSRFIHGKVATATRGRPGYRYCLHLLSNNRFDAPDSHSLIKPVRFPVTRVLHQMSNKLEVSAEFRFSVNARDRQMECNILPIQYTGFNNARSLLVLCAVRRQRRVMHVILTVFER